MTRVVAGLARGRRLAVPAGARPTGDRAREALFSSLASLMDLPGARVLDLYAGSGALGLEALSRGAAEVTLVEQDRAAVAILQANVAAVGLPGARVVPGDARRALAAVADGAVDLLLLDPPYADPLPPWPDLLRVLASDGVVVAERSARDAPLAWPAGVTGRPGRRYGEAMLWIGCRA